MSYSYNLKSHPNKGLVDHLKNVGRLSKEILDSKRIEDKAILGKVASLIGVTHDFAKATTFFQDLLNRGERSLYARHSSLSSLLTYQVVRGYLSTIDRLDEFRWLPVIAWVVVRRHHGNIHNLMGEEYAEITMLREPKERILIIKQIQNIMKEHGAEIQHILREILDDMTVQDFFEEIQHWDSLVKEIRTEVRNFCRESRLDNYMMTLFLYSVLLDADKMDASDTSMPVRVMNLRDDVVDEYLKKQFPRLDAIGAIRGQAYRDVTSSILELDPEKERLLSINIPTGTGKTLAGFSFSLKLREKVAKELGFAPRIIYCLPFLSIIDQNSEVIGRVLETQFPTVPSNLFLKHHHLADIRYVEEREGELFPVEEVNKALLLMEAWDSEIVVTTFVQFFHSLITNRNRAARKFHNITNSIIILDEVQAIPSKYWPLVDETLKLLVSKFNCWIILMTATQPLIFEPAECVRELVEDKLGYFNLFDRVEFQLDLDDRGNYALSDFEDFKEHVLNEVLKTSKNMMVVLNTIRASKELYEFLKNELLSLRSIDAKDCLDNDGICNVDELQLIYLSTHVLPATRLRRIGRIKDKSGRKIVVTTQLVEAGVDISVDIVYRDMAPLDCLVQTAGRCNRNNSGEKGEVRIVLLKDNNGRLFHSYVYEPYLVDATIEVLGKFKNRVSEKDFVTKAIAQYYEMIRKRGRTQESIDLINNLKRLEFADIVKFRLIEEGDDSVSIFIESGDEEESLRKEIQDSLTEKDRFKKKARLSVVKRSINEDTISVRYSKRLDALNVLPILIGEEFRYVPREHVSRWYRMDTGFTVPDNDIQMRII
jgi:CRISPR-associated endonuclease/helicase Cas3